MLPLSSSLFECPERVAQERQRHRTLVLKRVAVVKVLNEERRCSQDAEERFLREAQLASKLRHDYAAHIYDFGVAPEDGVLWIAMELVEGVSFREWLKTMGRWGP